MATPDVGDIFAEEYKFNYFTIYHKDIKSTLLFGMGVGYDTGHYFRFDIIGEYRASPCSSRGSDGFHIVDTGPTFPGNFNPGTNEWTADIRAGSACSTPMSISAPGIVSRPMSAAVSARLDLGARPEGRQCAERRGGLR
jgi:hypothetical protein